jgi:hypothetical protein
MGFQSVLPSKTENKIIDTQIQGAAAGSGDGVLLCLWHCSDPYANGYCWMCLQQQRWQKKPKIN